MHDWWLLLVAAYFGKVAYLEVPLISYRQHPNNKVGATSVSIKRMGSAIKRLRNEINRATKLYKGTLRQAEEFLYKYDQRLDESDKNLVNAYIKSGKSPLLYRKIIFIKNNFLYSNSIRKIFQLLFL